MFTFDTKVGYSRVNKNNQVPLYGILNYLQDCTNFHSESIGGGVEYMKSQGKAWVIIAYKIKINRPIMLGEDICVGTAPTDFGRLYASRKFFIKDREGQYLVQADSIWILMDLKTRKPARITENDYSIYNNDKEEGFENLNALKKLKLEGEKKKLSDFRVMKTYIDNNGHMNNADYLRAAEEFLPEDYFCHELDVVYAKEALENDIISPYIHDEADEIGIIFENNQGEVLTKIKLHN